MMSSSSCLSEESSNDNIIAKIGNGTAEIIYSFVLSAWVFWCTDILVHNKEMPLNPVPSSVATVSMEHVLHPVVVVGGRSHGNLPRVRQH